MSNKKYNQKHLTMTQRIRIEKGLIDGSSFSAIARQIDKHPSTIAKEVRRNRFFPPLKERKSPMPCARKRECQIRFLCDNQGRLKLCKSCCSPSKQAQYCSDVCPDYLVKHCPSLLKAPYVCNGCQKFKRYQLQHALYSAQDADANYYKLLVSSRDGINQSAADIAMLDRLISPLLIQGQSMAHIYANHGHEIPCSRRTLYSSIDKGVFEAKNIDLRRRVRYKIKERKSPARISLAAREFRIGRTYEDFQSFLKKNPETAVVEMDTVVGGLNNSTQVFLTMFFRSCSLMLIFPLSNKSQECDEAGALRTKVFFCNPNCSWQKGMQEKNHEYIRYVIPKGFSLDSYTWEDAKLLMNHINSEARDSLNGCTPYKLSLMLLNQKLHDQLGLKEVLPDEVRLKPSLLK